MDKYNNGASMTFRSIMASAGDYVQLSSDEWYVFDGKAWREMTVEEQVITSGCQDKNS